MTNEPVRKILLDEAYWLWVEEVAAAVSEWPKWKGGDKDDI